MHDVISRGEAKGMFKYTSSVSAFPRINSESVFATNKNRKCVLHLFYKHRRICMCFIKIYQRREIRRIDSTFILIQL